MLELIGGIAPDPTCSVPGDRAPLRMTSPPPEPIEPRLMPDDALPRDAFDSALAEYQYELVNYLGKRLADREAVADLAQETMLRMMKYRDSPDIEDRRLMLFRIANNLVNEYHRARHRHHASAHIAYDETVPLRSEQPAVESITDSRRAIELLLKHTIMQLPPKCRHAFMLSRFDDLSYSQIADRMDISVKMVEKHITKALLACRAAVGDRDF